jgi:hypothetical protein
MNSRVKDNLLNSMADDYSNFEMLFNEACERLGEQAPSRSDALEATEELITEGLAQAYILSPTQPAATPINFFKSDADQLWFYITSAGKRLITSGL